MAIGNRPNRHIYSGLALSERGRSYQWVWGYGENHGGIFLRRDFGACLEIAELGQGIGSDIRPEQAGSVDARIKRESNRLPKKTHGRGQEIRHRDRCLVENPAQHF
jgi:hypothetical protein